MRVREALILSFGLSAALALPAAAQDFDACTVFTQEDAEKTLGTTMAPEPVNPKVKRPKVVPNCTYTGSKDGKPVAATAQFKFGRTPEETGRAFDDARMQYQTKPLLVQDAESFWSGKTGLLYLRKGRTWVTLAVGGAKPSERDIEQARKLAEILVKKL